MWHPASLLIVWLGLVLGLARLPLFPLLLLSAACLVLAGLRAPERIRNLLRRSRWLLLSLGILFLFFTPGEYLSGPAGRFGLTFEGLRESAEQVGRLLAILASLALLHQSVGTQGLLAGCYWLLRPLPWRDATVVRLMLVLDLVEQKGRTRWREWLWPESPGNDEGANSLPLEMPAMRRRDAALIAAVTVLVLGVSLHS